MILPAKRLSRLYGVNHHIVSQTNPHIIPFIGDGKTQAGRTFHSRCRATSRTAREWLNASAAILRAPLSRRPTLQRMTDTVLSVINQDYVGDINILPPFSHPPTHQVARPPVGEGDSGPD